MNALQPAYSPFEGQRTSEDRYTAVQIVWTCYGALIASLAELVIEKPALGFDLVTWLSLAVMLAGLGLRTWAVVLLGRWFTWNVAVQPEQQLVERGPYKVIRHPSYTGALLMFLHLRSVPSSVEDLMTPEAKENWARQRRLAMVGVGLIAVWLLIQYVAILAT